MGDALFHSVSSATRHGGVAEDYLPIHRFLDQTKLYVGDWRHRALLHNTFGVALCEQVFGDFYTRPSDGQKVCTRTIATHRTPGIRVTGRVAPGSSLTVGQRMRTVAMLRRSV